MSEHDHIEHLLDDWLAGRLSPDEEAWIAAHAATCDPCDKAFEAATHDFATLAQALPRVSSSARLKGRILGDLAPGERFMGLADRVAQLADLTLDRARALLRSIDDASNWVAGPFPSVDLFHIKGGPATAGAIVGFVRLEAGATFPEHTHRGTESVVVLQGAMRDADGTTFRVGNLDRRDGGTSHDFVALPGPPLIYLVVAFDGIEVGGEVIGPDDPRL